MNNLFPAPMLFALLVFPHNLSAQSATHCPMTADDSNCVRVVACIGMKVFGLTVAPLGGAKGHLAVMCENVDVPQCGVGICHGLLKGRVFYTYQDEYTGTAVGHRGKDKNDLRTERRTYPISLVFFDVTHLALNVNSV